jgi:hypothetical protein
MFFVLQYKRELAPAYFPNGSDPSCNDYVGCIEQAQIFRADLMRDTPSVTPPLPYNKSLWVIKQIEIHLK